MADRFPHPKFRSFLADGTPNASGKVYIYETGTTTKVAAGQVKDARSGSNTANPVILDAAGEGDIWLAEGSQYTIKIDTSADVQLSSTDGVSASDLATWVASGSNIYYSAGQVYIGGTSGSEDLTVTGTASVSGVFSVAGAVSFTSTTTMTGTMAVTLGGESYITAVLGTGIIINNDASSSCDLRVESAADTHFLFLDASGEALHIGGTGTGDIAVFNASAIQLKQAVAIQTTLDVQDNLSISVAAKQLRVNGGAATDFIGQATLSGGTITVANTNISTADRILISRSSTSSAYGELRVSISAATSFTITSDNGSDNGQVDYFIVREL